MPELSVVINLDTRKGFLEGRTGLQPGTQAGVLSADFLIDGIFNKTQFFPKDTEFIVCVDCHEPIPDMEKRFLLDLQKKGIIDILILKKHNETLNGNHNPKWLDFTILNAMMMATGTYVAHFDQDMFIAAKDPEAVIGTWIDLLDNHYMHVCYPSPFSPYPVKDPDFEGEYFWASSRFHIFNRMRILDYSEIQLCLSDSEYLYHTYGEKKRQCPWLEHIFGIIAGWGQVYYPPIDLENYMLFSWSQYHPGILAKLEKMSYEQKVKYVMSSGGITYPCDVRGRKL